MCAWVGGSESAAFLDQATMLADAWPLANVHVDPGKTHFSVIDGLGDPDSVLVRTLLA